MKNKKHFERGKEGRRRKQGGTEWGGRQQAESVNRKEDANVKFPFLADIIPGGSIQQLLMWINLLKFLNCAVNPCSKSNIPKLLSSNGLPDQDISWF